MFINLNGKKREIRQDITVSHLLEELGVKEKAVAVEVNGNIVPRGEFGNTQLREGDNVEILHIVGGGKSEG